MLRWHDGPLPRGAGRSCIRGPCRDGSSESCAPSARHVPVNMSGMTLPEACVPTGRWACCRCLSAGSRIAPSLPVTSPPSPGKDVGSAWRNPHDVPPHRAVATHGDRTGRHGRLQQEDRREHAGRQQRQPARDEPGRDTAGSAAAADRLPEGTRGHGPADAEALLEQLLAWGQGHRRQCWPLPPQTGWAFASGEWAKPGQGRGWSLAEAAWEGGHQQGAEHQGTTPGQQQLAPFRRSSSGACEWICGRQSDRAGLR